jgi:hypothetical protein
VSLDPTQGHSDYSIFFSEFFTFDFYDDFRCILIVLCDIAGVLLTLAPCLSEEPAAAAFNADRIIFAEKFVEKFH